jgi:hypothetical protein
MGRSFLGLLEQQRQLPWAEVVLAAAELTTDLDTAALGDQLIDLLLVQCWY